MSSCRNKSYRTCINWCIILSSSYEVHVMWSYYRVAVLIQTVMPSIDKLNKYVSIDPIVIVRQLVFGCEMFVLLHYVFQLLQSMIVKIISSFDPMWENQNHILKTYENSTFKMKRKSRVSETSQSLIKMSECLHSRSIEATWWRVYLKYT